MTRNNLMKDALHRGTYYTVTRAFTVYALVGHSDSNTYYGASMICGNVYRREQLRPGDEVHALCGGTYAVRLDGELLAVALTISEKSPFEKTYGGACEYWPLDALQETATPTAVSRYPHTFPRIAPGPERIGRSIDTVLA